MVPITRLLLSRSCAEEGTSQTPWQSSHIFQRPAAPFVFSLVTIVILINAPAPSSHMFSATPDSSSYKPRPSTAAGRTGNQGGCIYRLHRMKPRVAGVDFDVTSHVQERYLVLIGAYKAGRLAGASGQVICCAYSLCSKAG